MRSRDPGAAKEDSRPGRGRHLVEDTPTPQPSTAKVRRRTLALLTALGPGLIAGASDNDPTTVLSVVNDPFQCRVLMARAARMTTNSSDVKPSTIIRTLTRLVRGSVSVGLKAVALVKATNR